MCKIYSNFRNMNIIFNEKFLTVGGYLVKLWSVKKRVRRGWGDMVARAKKNRGSSPSATKDIKHVFHFL